MSDKRLVWRVEEGMDRQEVYATTYQMRNFYQQLRDGYFSDLDVFNYIQHHQVARMVGAGNHLLDVCCGRGLLLPLLRYRCKDLGSYTGVDIEPRNARFLERRVTDGKPLEEGYYPFPVNFVECDAARMAGDERLSARRFQVLVYTSALEHMHPDVGRSTLRQCRALAAPRALLILTSPRRQPGADGYRTRYRAHVYEWTREEIEAGLEASGWEIETVYGLTIGGEELGMAAEEAGLGEAVSRLRALIPAEWHRPLLAPLFPERASELAYVCRAK